MNISNALAEAINQQINNEFNAAYQYLAKAAFLDGGPLKGFGHWMRLQAEEEKTHALKLLDYLNDRNGTVALQTIEAPQPDCSSPLAIFQGSYEQEQKVTAQIHDLYGLALEEKDYATLEILNWFLKEQVEEEEAVRTMIERLELAGDDKGALLLLDAEAGQRNAD